MIYNKYLHDTTSSTARLVVQWLYYGIIQWVLPIGYGMCWAWQIQEVASMN